VIEDRGEEIFYQDLLHVKQVLILKLILQ